MKFDDDNCTYFLCPNSSCKLFTKPDCHVPCDQNCPQVKQMKKVIVCWNCGEVIMLPGGHRSCCRVDCDCCGASNFQRMSGIYRRVYQ